MPKPVQFWSNDEIEEKAAEVLDGYVPGGRQKPKLPIDIDTLTEISFRFKVVWEPIADPPGCQTFATLQPIVGNDKQVARLTLNESFREFLAEHPEIERFTRGHELCHWLIHIDVGKLKTGLLFAEEIREEVRYHRSHYNSGQLTSEQKNRLAKFAAQNAQAYRLLKPRESDPEACIEPQWMHRQAEQFSACLLVPRVPLIDFLNRGDDPASYVTHTKLATAFQVSKQVVQIRMKKLDLIDEVAANSFRNVGAKARKMF